MSEGLLNTFRRRFSVVEGSVPHEPIDFLYEVGDVISALLYAELIVPGFVEVDGSVLLEFKNTPEDQNNFREMKKNGRRPLGDLELSFNFIEVPYLFSNRGGSYVEDRMLAERIADAWQCRLKFLYPGRTFVVSALDADVTGSVAGVHFYELRIISAPTP